MKKLILALLSLLMNDSLLSQTYHTITIDGTNDFTTSTEQFTTTSGTTLYGYITWDATNLYFGFSGNTPAGSVTDDNRAYHIYIDTDPQLTPTNGTGTTDGETWRWDPTLPFTANYHYTFKTIDNSEYKKVYSGGWTGSSFSTSNYKGSGFWEISITRSGIGSPTQMYVLMYVEEDWNGGSICGGVPSNLFTNTSTGGAITFNSHWYGYNLVSGVTPNDGSNLDNALPVELTSFTASVKGNVVTLNWQTATEVNNYGFEIQRADVNSNFEFRISKFEKIGFVEGHGNSNSPKEYSFTDNLTLTLTHTLAYRLKQIDNDGSFTYSNVVEVFIGELPNGFVLEQNYPNPFNPSTKIRFGFDKQTEGTLKVFNSNGEEVAELFSGRLDAGRIYEVEFSTKDGLASGVYFYKLQTPELAEVKKMLLLK